MIASILLAYVTATVPQIQIQSSTTDSTVSVTMTRTLRVVASGASMYVTVDGSGETTSAALARVADKLKVVTDSLARLGKRVIAETPIPYRVGPLPQQGGYPAPSTTGFIAYTLIRVRVPNIQDFAQVQAVMLSAGAASITGQSFEVTSADSVWKADVETATAAARSTAALLARSHGKRMGSLLDMSASGNGGGYGSPSQISLDPRSASYSQGAPEIIVYANVTVRYRLLPDG